MNIIVLLILTILLYKLLFSNFGFMSEEERKRQEEAINSFIKNGGFQNGGKSKIIVIGDKEAFDKMYENYTKKTTSKVSKTDKKLDEFDEKTFLKAIEKLITLISEAFSEKNTDVLGKVLTKDLFKVFKDKIDNMNGRIYKSVIVSFKDMTIENKIIAKKTKSVSVKVRTDQVNYVEDENGNIITGSKDKSSEITELWTFIESQDTNNGVPATVWLLESIDNVQI